VLTVSNNVDSPTAKAGADAAFPASPSAVNTFFVEVDGGRIACDDSGGDGPLIIAIPGSSLPPLSTFSGDCAQRHPEAGALAFTHRG